MTQASIVFIISVIIFSLITEAIAIINTEDSQHIYKYKHFNFSIRNYYVVVLPILLAIIATSIITNNLSLLIYFIVFSIAGIIGETIFSLWWKHYFNGRFWTYSVETMLHGYTSILNLIPWGLGGITYLFIISNLNNAIHTDISNLKSILTFDLLLILLFDLQFLITHYYSKTKQIKYVFHNRGNIGYFLFFVPIIMGLIMCALWSPYILLIFTIAGLLAALEEYLFGKACQFFIKRKFWTYEYLPMDNGHFTPLSILPFILGGIYFWSIFVLVSNL